MAFHTDAVESHSGHNPFLRAVKFISLFSGWVAASMIVAAVVITCQMIFIRFVLNGSTVWQTEAVVYLMIAATLVGLPYVQRLRGHVNVDLIPLALSVPQRKWLYALTLSLSIAVVLIMLWFGAEFWHLAWSRNWKSDTIWAVPLWIPYLSIPIGFGLLGLQLIADFVAMIVGVDKPFGLEDE